MRKALSDLLTLSQIRDILKEQSIDITFKDECHVAVIDYSKLNISLKSFCDVQFKDLTIHGDTEVKAEFEFAREFFSKLGRSIGSEGRLSVSFKFQEKESAQYGNDNDLIYICQERGKWYFDYTCCESKIARDKAYGLNAFKEMVRLLSLPITVLEADSHYELKHSEDLYFRTSGGFLGKNPDSFFCEISGADIDSMIKRVEDFIPVFSTGKITGLRWGAGYSPIADGVDPDSELVLRLYNTTVEQNVPALNNTLWLSFELESIEGLQAIAPLCSDGKSIAARYGIIKISRQYIGLSVVVVENGFKLELEATNDKHFSEISERLGIGFE